VGLTSTDREVDGVFTERLFLEGLQKVEMSSTCRILTGPKLPQTMALWRTSEETVADFNSILPISVLQLRALNATAAVCEESLSSSETWMIMELFISCELSLLCVLSGLGNRSSSESFDLRWVFC